MSKIETNTNPLMTRVKEAFNFLSETATNGTAENVEKTLFHLKYGNLVFGFNDPQYPIVSPGLLTDYENVVFDPSQSKPVKRTIVIDHVGIMKSTKGEFASDLARTLFVANQDFDDRFQRGYKEIYAEALSREDEWRRVNNLAGHETNFRLRLKRVLGEARYFSDISFGQWQSTIDQHAVFAVNGERDKLLEMKKHPEDFIIRRSVFLRELHAGAKDKIGTRYLTGYSQEERVKIIGSALVQTITGENRANPNMLQ